MKRMGKGMARALAMVLVLGLFLCSVPSEVSAEEGREAAEILQQYCRTEACGCGEPIKGVT